MPVKQLEPKNRIKLIYPDMSPISADAVLEVNGVNLTEALCITKLTLEINPQNANRLHIECMLADGMEVINVPAEVHMSVIDYREKDLEQLHKDSEARQNWVKEAQALISESSDIQFSALSFMPKDWYKARLTEIYELNHILTSKDARRLAGYPSIGEVLGAGEQAQERMEKAKELLGRAGILEI
jgi:hypothetical protein